MPADVGFFRAVGGIVFGNRQLFLIIGQIRFLTLIIFFNIGFLFRRQLVGKFADVNVFRLAFHFQAVFDTGGCQFVGKFRRHAVFENNSRLTVQSGLADQCIQKFIIRAFVVSALDFNVFSVVIQCACSRFACRFVFLGLIIFHTVSRGLLIGIFIDIRRLVLLFAPVFVIGVKVFVYRFVSAQRFLGKMGKVIFFPAVLFFKAAD